LPPLFLSFALEFTIRKIQENRDGLELNGTHQLLVYADDVDLLSGNISIIKRNTVALLNTGKEVGQK
jgi:hypothetical protein